MLHFVCNSIEAGLSLHRLGKTELVTTGNSLYENLQFDFRVALINI